MKAGVYGNWKKSNVRKDLTIVQQKSEKGVGCVSAVGEMLLKSRKINVPQQEILDIIGEPAGIGALRKMNSFVITKIKSGSENELLLTVLIDGETKNFKVNFQKNGSISLPDKLEKIIIGKDFNQTRKLLKILSDYQNGFEISLPSVVFAASPELTFA
jgi:hypothetical protein